MPSLASAATAAPHITLAAAEDALPAEIEAALPAALTELPVPVRLGGLLLFGSDPIILVRTVTPTVALLALYTRLADLMTTVSGLSEFTRRERWSPHVTLAYGLRPHDLPRAISTLAALHEVDGSAVSARRWDSIASRTWPLIAAG